MVSVLEKNKRKGNQTVAQVLADQEQQALKQAVSPAVTNGNANVATATYAEDRELNEMLTFAAQCGERLDSDEGYKADAADIVKASEVLDTKAVTMLKHLEDVLSDEELSKLPVPMSTKAEADAGRREGDNTPRRWFDKPKASAGRSKSETFYGTMIKNTTLGRVAVVTLEALDKEDALAVTQPSKARHKHSRDIDRKRANRSLNNLLSAMRLGVNVRMLMRDIREETPHIVVRWVREGTHEEFDATGKDLSRIHVDGAGDVVLSSSCIQVYSTKGAATLDAAILKQILVPIGTFKRWNVGRAMELAKKEQRKFITVDDLIESAKKKPPTPRQTPPASSVSDADKDKRWRPTDIVDVKRSTEGWLKWYRGDSPVDQAAHEMDLVKSSNASEELNASLYAQYKILARIFMDGSKENKAIEYWAKAGEKAA